MRIGEGKAEGRIGALHEEAISMILAERYEFMEPLRQDRLVATYRGRDQHLDRPVVIKQLLYDDPEYAARFLSDAQAASTLRNPQLVQVYDFGRSESGPFVVMELVEGSNLQRLLRQKGQLAHRRAALIAFAVALGLGAAHKQGIVHRSVMPRNILLGLSSNKSIKLTDFGSTSLSNNVHRFSPEQAEGKLPTAASDIYTLGIVMYEMVTGRLPFEGDNPVEIAIQHIENPPPRPTLHNLTIPEPLEAIILRCLEKAPEKRYHDGSSLAHALKSYVESSPPT